MQDKQKVTLYLSPELHRRLKIKSAVDAEAMSSLVERAIGFYLTHPEIVDEVEAAHGRTHQVYNCPDCASPVVLREGKMVSLGVQPGILESETALAVKQGQKVNSTASTGPDQPGEEELVPC